MSTTCPRGMKKRSRYKITIEDESRLENLAEYTATPIKWTLTGIAVALLLMVCGAAVAFLTPVRTLLPGYLKESERTASEIQLLRLDSLRNAYETNAAFLDNIMNVLSPSGYSADTAAMKMTDPLTLDSLLPTSREEQRFVALMREREKYNVSVLAPLAAESLMFTPVSDESVFSEDSRESLRGEVILAKGSTVATVADGIVIAVSQTIRDGGSTVIIQHPKGFLSRISRLGTVLVEPGDAVTGGQVIALCNHGNARDGERITIEMWRNGDRLVPYEYIGDRQPHTPRLPVFAPRDQATAEE